VDDLVRARERAARAAPEDEAARAALLVALERARDTGGLERLADERPDDPEAGRALARALLAAGRDAEAWAARVRSGTTDDPDAAPLREALSAEQRPVLEGLRAAVPDGRVVASDQVHEYDPARGGVPVVNLAVSAGLRTANACRPALRWIGALRSIVRLSLISPWLDDDDLTFLARLPALDELHLEHARGFDGAGLSSLPRRLRSLFSLNGPLLNADALTALERLPRLRSLSLRRSTFEPAAAAVLGRFAQLEELDVSRSSGLAPPVLAEVLQLASLRSLELGEVLDLTDALLAQAALPRLKSVDLFETRIRSRGLAALARSPRLRSVAAHGTDVDDVALEALAGHSALEVVSLRRARVEGRGLAAIARCPRLRALDVGSAHLDGAHLASLRGAPRLAHLGLFTGRVQDEHLEVLRDLPALESLDLSGTHITDAGLLLLERLPPSVRIDISGTTTTPAGRSAFAAARPRR
jgi:hypothetical protein